MSEILGLKTIEETKRIRKRGERKKEIKEYTEKHKALRKYLNTLSNPRNHYNCAMAIIRFCEIMETNPTELCSHSTPQEREVKRYKGEQLVDDFEDYWIEWRKENPTDKSLTISTALSIVYSIRGMFRVNKVDLAKEVGKRILKLAPVSFETYTPTMEDIRHFRDTSPYLRDKVLIHFVSILPLRRNEVRQLRWRDLEGFPHEEYSFVILRPERLKGKKKGVWFVGIITKSLKKDLIEWQKEQKAQFKRLNQNWSLNTPIWSPLMKLRISKTKMMSYDGFNNATSKITVKFFKKYNIRITLHDLRRYFEKQIEIARQHGVPVSKKYSYWFLGHKLEGVEFHYNQVEPHVPLIIELFKELEPFIDIDCTRPQISKWDKLEKEKEKLQARIRELEEIIQTLKTKQ